MIVDTNKLKQKIEAYYNDKMTETECDKNISDSRSIKKLTRLENRRFAALELICKIDRLAGNFLHR